MEIFRRNSDMQWLQFKFLLLVLLSSQLVLLLLWRVVDMRFMVGGEA